ncbi:hypothetical protein IWZ01DRAFT_194051 [Phyllosticta capitalensis]
MGERPHKCSHCSKAFSRSDNLLQHYRTVHGLDGGPPHNGERSRGGRRKTTGTLVNSPYLDGIETYAGNDDHGHSDELSPGLDSNSNARSPGQDSLELDRLAGNDPDQPEDQESEDEQNEKIDEDVEDQEQMDLQPDVNAEGSSSIRHPQVVCYRCNESITQTPLRDRDNRPICEICLDQLRESPTTPGASSSHLQCRNCHATQTSKWRKDENGDLACSACYLYFRKHKRNRPRKLQDLKDMKSCYYCNTYLGYVPTLDENGHTRCAACDDPSQRPLVKADSSASVLQTAEQPDLSDDGTPQLASIPTQGTSWQAINRNTSAEPTVNRTNQRATSPGQHKSQSEPAKRSSAGTIATGVPEEEYYDQSCANCQTAETSIWKVDIVGRRICNACYQYYEIHGVNRPPYLRKEHLPERSRSRTRDETTSGEAHHPSTVASSKGTVDGQQERSSETAHEQDYKDDFDGKELRATADSAAGEEETKNKEYVSGQKNINESKDANKENSVKQGESKGAFRSD